jgi:hypothetical protein
MPVDEGTSYESLAGESLDGPKLTKISAAFESPSRLELAVAAGADLHDTTWQRIAGRLSSTATLAKAHELGMPWTHDVCLGVLHSGSLPKLQWLVDEQLGPLHPDATSIATYVGDVATLAWLQQRGATLNLRVLSNMAAATGNWPLLGVSA